LLRIILDDGLYRLVRYVGHGRRNAITRDRIVGVVKLWGWNVIITKLLPASNSLFYSKELLMIDWIRDL